MRTTSIFSEAHLNFERFCCCGAPECVPRACVSFRGTAVCTAVLLVELVFFVRCSSTCFPTGTIKENTRCDKMYVLRTRHLLTLQTRFGRVKSDRLRFASHCLSQILN